MPPSTMTSASPTFAQVTPIAPNERWRRAIHGDLWPFECGRQFLPPAWIVVESRPTLRLEPVEVEDEGRRVELRLGRPMSESVAGLAEDT